VHHIAHRQQQDPAVLPRHIEGVADLGRGLDQRAHAFEIHPPHPHHGANGMAQGQRVDDGAVAGDDASVFQALDALADCRLAQMHAPTQFGQREARVALQFDQDAVVLGIEIHVQGVLLKST